jgi:hypothetical protein
VLSSPEMETRWNCGTKSTSSGLANSESFTIDTFFDLEGKLPTGEGDSSFWRGSNVFLLCLRFLLCFVIGR